MDIIIVGRRCDKNYMYTFGVRLLIHGSTYAAVEI